MSYYQEHPSHQQEEQTQNLLNLSYVVINNSIQFKMDKIADVFIHGLPYFTVFRRYNSPYEIVLEDMKGETYLHKDQTVRESLQAVLCLSPQHAAQLYTTSAHSYKHHAPLCSLAFNLADLRWSELQDHYGAVFVDFGGILLEFQEVCERMRAQQEPEEKEQEPPRTPIRPRAPKVVPNAPHRPAPVPKNETIYPETLQEEPWSILIPVTDESLIPRIAHTRDWVCYCECKEDDEEDTQYQDSDGDFTVLRNGTRIRKIQTKTTSAQKRQKHY